MEDVNLQIGKMLIFVSFLSIGFASGGGVPLFLWSTNKLDLPASATGHTTTNEEFNQHYLDTLLASEQNVVAFVQDKLSVDDVTHHADVYNEQSDGAALHNLKDLLEQHSSTQLPSVKNVPGILKKLRQKFSGKVHELTAPFDVGDLPLDGTSNLIITRLPPTGETGAQFGQQLQKNDEIIKSVSEGLKSTGQPLTAFFTAEKSSQKRRHQLYAGRHLLQDADAAAETNVTYVNISDGALVLYATQIEVTLLKITGVTTRGRTSFILPNNPEVSGSAGNATGTLNMKYKNVKSSDVFPGKKAGVMDTVELSFKFEIGSGTTWTGFWRLSGFNISYSGQNDTSGTPKWTAKDLPVKGYDIYAPYTAHYMFSYHCTQTAPYFQQLPADNKQGSQVSVKFSNFQVQYSRNAIPKFGRPNDCDGFFTIPILSGLFAGLILILILFYGISMIANISTMDRFDDPKGKTITVNVSE